MKKTVTGAALMICGAIFGCTEYLAHQILFAAPDVSVIGENYLLKYGGVVLFLGGVALCIAGFLSKKEEKESER